MKALGAKKSGAQKAAGRKGSKAKKKKLNIFTVPLGNLTLAHLLHNRLGNENSKPPFPAGVLGELSNEDVARIAKAVVALQRQQKK